MTNYVLIESRSGREAPEADLCFGLATALREGGDEVTVFLVQNGVLSARRGAANGALAAALNAGVTLLADEFSLRERGIAGDQVASDIYPSPLDVVIDRLAAGDKVVWN